MIIENLYPVDDTIDVGYPNADKEVELTSRFGIDPVLSMDAYWLGYITHDTLPMQYCCAMVYQEEETEDVIIKEITDKVNFPCGYVYDDYGRTTQYRETIYQNADGTETYPSSAWAWLFNSNFPEYSGLMYKYDRSESCLMSAYCYIYNQGDQLVYPYDDSSNYAYMTIFQSGGDATYIDEIYKFLFLGEHYDATINILEGGESKTLHFDITADLFEDGTAYISDTTGNYSARLYLAGFYFGEGAGIAGEGASGPSTITFPAAFTVKTSESYNDHHNEHIEKGTGYHEYYDRLWYARYDIPTISDPQFVYGVKADIRIPKNAFSNITTVGTYLFQDGVLIHKNDNRIYISGINTIDDIRKSFSLYYRVCRENIASYVAGKTYATDVTPSNEFLARLKTGDIQDNNFKNSLRPWQYGNFNEDDFDEEDVPGEDPGPDGDWDPDTVPEEDENDYEYPPKTQLHQPFLGAIGQTWWAMTPLEWSGIVRNVKQILTTWNEYVTFDIPINQKNIHAEFEKNKYSSGFVANPVDCVASVMWYPFDITLLLDFTAADFVWGGTTQVIMTGVDEDGAPETTTTEQSIILGYLDNAYWLDGGFTDYFKHYNNFIDYQPYCTAELYIPYCGSVKIDPQQYVGHHLSVRYLVDFPTGACLALVYRDNLVVDSIAGQIGVTIAMSMPDYIEYGGRHMQAATNVKASKFQQLGTIWGTMGKALTGDVSGAIMGAPAISAGFEMLKNAEYQLDNTLINQKTISTATPAISTGNEQVCRLVLYQPRWLDGYENKQYGQYGHTTGFKTIENKKLKNFTGLTIADSIDTSGIGQATEKEKAMIQKAFKGGVYMPN